MPNMTPIRADHPMMSAWKLFQESGDFENLRNQARYAGDMETIEGALWGVFSRTWRMALERAADLHPDVDNTSDAERLEGIPGAGAMGAVIEYRDKIRKLAEV